EEKVAPPTSYVPSATLQKLEAIVRGLPQVPPEIQQLVTEIQSDPSKLVPNSMIILRYLAEHPQYFKQWVDLAELIQPHSQRGGNGPEEKTASGPEPPTSYVQPATLRKLEEIVN